MEAFAERLIQLQKTTLPTSPMNIDVIFDIGALNGGYGAGVALYLRRLELLQHVQVHRVSGCSIGAFLAAWYCSGCQESLMNYAENMFIQYKRNASFTGYESIMQEFVNAAFASDNEVRALRGRLYINFYDTKRHRQVVVTKFKSRQHLAECILRSSHIPYVINGQARRHKRFMDGMVPHIFNDRLRPCLFVDMLSVRKLWRVFITRAEVTIYQRLLVGVMDAHEFFVTQRSSDMCSWQTKWPWWYHGFLQSRLFGCLSVLYLVEWGLVMWRHVGVLYDFGFLNALCQTALQWLQRHFIQG
jgi:hypothetical protein